MQQVPNGEPRPVFTTDNGKGTTFTKRPDETVEGALNRVAPKTEQTPAEKDPYITSVKNQIVNEERTAKG